MKKTPSSTSTEAKPYRRRPSLQRRRTREKLAPSKPLPKPSESSSPPSLTSSPSHPHDPHHGSSSSPATLEPTTSVGRTSAILEAGCSVESTLDQTDCTLEAFWAQVSLEAGAMEPPTSTQADVCRKNNVVKKQTTLFSFLSVQGSSKKRETDVAGLNGVKRQKMERFEPKPSSSQESDSKKVERQNKSCPFYKKIPGTAFTVDAFRYGSILNCTAYFLSHFHADHYAGLKKSFHHPIYCSQVTGNLVRQQLKVSAEHVHVRPLNEPFMLDKVDVTFLEANHCPGSVLILFKLKSGQNYLHTGDFRFSPCMLQYPALVGLTIHQLYLDTTYCDPRYNFPVQEQVIGFAVDKCLNAMHSCPNTLIVCGTYTIGKEKVFRAIADVLGVKICVSKEKKAVLDCLECPSLSDSLTTDYSKSCLHVLPMAKLSLKALSVYYDNWSGRYSKLLAFKPTGWTYSGVGSDLSSLVPQVTGAITIYGIPYSEHSSYAELRGCVQGLRPRKIIPTVNNFSEEKREEMQRTFREWLSQRDSKLLVQSKLKKS